MKDLIRKQALDIGFDAVGFADASTGARDRARLDAFIAEGHHGEMDWMARNIDRRKDPKVLWSEVRSVIAVAVNYGPDSNPLTDLKAKAHGNISVYARNRDYHYVLKKRLKKLGRWLGQVFDCDLKVFVDTAPVLEKPLAHSAGVGWQGKHSNLVSREFGSWIFLGEIFTTLKIKPDKMEIDHCGSCRQCLDVCPTSAFPKPYILDASRCISYLTIEFKGHIPLEFRKPIGNRIYGCDDCLAICPWNKFSKIASDLAFVPRDDLKLPLLEELISLDDKKFRKMFSGSPIKRIGRDRFIRNTLIALGNSGTNILPDRLLELLEDPAPIVRAMAVWAVGELGNKEAIKGLFDRCDDLEKDNTVRQEWETALNDDTQIVYQEMR
ncbi:MAG: tRNA epoxyqueuosine(34) reductase QueG [Rhodospirillaceae bacterium]|nr:tRNA epoxyqueuosine(34) reductase QueG [Rhodospirillaceae bacterium]|tara:strand:+ start:4727 stop:5869 length:1143 start_codon:yes stop_codon:yes gene_type:complete